MKKTIVTLIAVAAIILLQSCAGSARHCAAYAKHETGNRPSYGEVQ